MGDKKVKLSNPHLKEIDSDKLYHIGFASSDNLKEDFGDVKFVCLGGSSGRMKRFSQMLCEELKVKFNSNISIEDFTKSDRFSMYKVGPIICASHGMGVPSASILVCEMIKMLHYADVTDVTIFRVGTSGGLGIDAGTVVVTRRALDHKFEPFYEIPILGKTQRFPTGTDDELAKELQDLCGDDIPVRYGDTMCANDFYEAQARLDGPFCGYTSEEKMQYLHDAHKAGVLNVEMECTGFTSLCRRAGIRVAIVCVALLNRLNGDQVSKGEMYHVYERRPLVLVSRYICKKLKDSHYSK
ncbi:uncharacterized protein TRIADDRAFT_31186 [Trichoplax adhaerens]|uniref:Nucleoside phosphorylase domain-containing protein n=1 Tax=Trichoplax adhaerens TaxID=10228 RepID=B3S8H0_TRIAD|nr:hypothetical protein TRIADDRAFT_31186 [Trichoplax adhaerens]EDV20885.1 hypothetical protein TRIADDRAFT_31186 [Trichoplax adhaerens]|eukprot:XP_002116529.1 hypothetical protein TRIADDRAFT_31186 [Trichoplax adhaerens]